jgi:hypothetical protein
MYAIDDYLNGEIELPVAFEEFELGLPFIIFETEESANILYNSYYRNYKDDINLYQFVYEENWNNHGYKVLGYRRLDNLEELIVITMSRVLHGDEITVEFNPMNIADECFKDDYKYNVYYKTCFDDSQLVVRNILRKRKIAYFIC